MNRNHEVLQEKTRPVTRFIALGKVGNPKKLKWLYAFNIVPMVKMPAAKLNEQPAGTTPSPFGVAIEEQEKSEERKVYQYNFFFKSYLLLNLILLQEAIGNQFFYDVSADVMAGRNNRQGNKRKHQDARPPRPPPKPMGTISSSY